MTGGNVIALALALGELLLAGLAPGEVRRESWPNGQPRAEYTVEVRDGHESREGECRTWHENGVLASEGSFASDAETGRWTFQHLDGSRAAEGSYARGERTGVWETFHPGGPPESKGRYVKGARSGDWRFWRADGTPDPLHTGRYEPVAMRFDDGRTLAGQTLDGARHGLWTSTWPDGAPQFEGTFERGERTGAWRLFEPGGALAPAFSGHYRAGRREAPPEETPTNRPPPEIVPGLPGPEGEARAIEAELTSWLAANATERAKLAGTLLQRDTRPTWLRAGMRSLPILLERMRACDPERPEGRAVLAWLERLFLRKLCNEHVLVPLPSEGPSTAEEARAHVRAWTTLWAATASDPWFWSVEVPHTPPAPDVEILREGPFRRVFGDATGARERPALLAARFEPRAGPYEAPLQAALVWLERNQRPDGGWNVSFAPGEVSASHHHEAGVSALALLALLGAGRDPGESAAVARAVGYLLDLQDPVSGRIGELVSFDWFYTHAIATLALAEVQLLRPSAALRGPLQRAVDLLLAARNPYGAWRYEVPPTGENDTSVTVWAATALFLARQADCQGDIEAALQGSLSWLDEVADRATGREGYSAFGELSSRSEDNQQFPREHGEALTAASLFLRRLLGQSIDDPLLAKQVQLLLRALPQWDPEGLRVDEYYFYYGAQALALCGGKAAEAWNKALRPVALAQSGNERARGSWDPVGVWSYTGGRVYSTALLALMLEAPSRYRLPEPADKKPKRGR